MKKKLYTDDDNDMMLMVMQMIDRLQIEKWQEDRYIREYIQWYVGLEFIGWSEEFNVQGLIKWLESDRKGRDVRQEEGCGFTSSICEVEAQF